MESFQQIVLERLTMRVQKKLTWPKPTTKRKKSKWIIDLNVKPKAIKLLQENRRSLWLWFRHRSLHTSPMHDLIKLINWISSKWKILAFERHHWENEKTNHELVKKYIGIYFHYVGFSNDFMDLYHM